MLLFSSYNLNIMSILKLVITITVSLAIVATTTHAQNRKVSVTYDGRSIIIGGNRELLFSGSIHYPRSTPEMWDDILEKAKHGGINVISTYVFWNLHETVPGKFKVEPQHDFIEFMKLIQKKDMYVCLRLGPFIQAEWNHGGLPYWLREIPEIIFRSDNEAFKKYMKNFVVTVVKMCKDANLFAPQGGPIILAQIENEYNHVQRAFREDGITYVQWAAKLAVAMDVGVPWIMCKQTDAPDPLINACNGRHCGDTFTGPNKPYKPAVWTENWVAQYRVFGDPPSVRSAEDIAFSIVRFFSKNGSMSNYYMYHGGTNFGRTTSDYSTTRYYDEAPLDEYGLKKEPKWSHLRDAHKALSLCSKVLFSGQVTVTKLSQHYETIVFEKGDLCAAFITNNHTKQPTTIKFRGNDYFLPPRSISVLPDCKTVVFNTQHIASQHNSRTFRVAPESNKLKWEVYQEPIPTTKEIPTTEKIPLELFTLLKDTTDYAWYTTSVELGPEDLPTRAKISPVLRIMTLGHVILAFVNGKFVASCHGSHESKGCDLQKPIELKVGVNHITLLAGTVGLPDSGAFMEHRYAGPKSIIILGLNSGKIDLTHNGWGNQIGLHGEKIEIFTEEGSKKVQWKEAKGRGLALSWYKTNFETPAGNSPVAIQMHGMGKGMIWINGKSIGRHWMSFLSPLGEPTQSEYHIPRAYLNPKDNLLVILEEEESSLDKVSIVTVERDTICSLITHGHPPNVNSWAIKSEKFQAVVSNPSQTATLRCPHHSTIKTVEFASYGDPQGTCGNFTIGKCHAPAAKEIVEKHCLGQPSCAVALDKAAFTKGQEICPGELKALAIQVKCG